MKSHKGNAAVILLLIVMALVGIAVALRLQSPNPLLQIPTIVPQATETSVKNPDGNKKLIMRTARGADGSNTFKFFTADIPVTNETLIFTKTASAGATMSIPPNSWAPENKYVFIQKNEGGLLSIYVLKASGEPFGSVYPERSRGTQGKPSDNNAQYLDIGALFTQNQTKYVLQNATGWASPTLLIFTTSHIDPAVKTPNYWFEVPSRAFLQLAR